MSNLAFMEGLLKGSSPEQAYASMASLLPGNGTTADKVSAIEAALGTPVGRLLRAQVGKLIVEKFVPVEALVPPEYENWRPPVRDAMLFVISHLSDARLAPKLLEQIELPPNTPPETRLLRLIAKVPGLQKLGQVIARNHYLRPALRAALSQLENGIRDVSAEEMCAIIRQELGARAEAYAVHIEPSILSEASVSAVLRFTCKDPKTGEPQRGVFKALKSYIPACFAEDMELLQGLADFFGSKHCEYGLAKDVLTDTFTKVRRLLQHEVHFVGEQKTLVEAYALYGSLSKVRVPRIYQALCTSKITAMSEEHGEKVTEAVGQMSAQRRGQVAEQLIETLIAVPLFAPQESALFHADPHAGNLFYDNQTGELIILDWALTERLSLEQRRHLALLVLMVGLRDPVGACSEIQMLSQGDATRRDSKQAKIIRQTVAEFFEEQPLRWLPGAVDAMRLLQRTAGKGIRFASSLIMLSKVLFTLDGVVADIRGSGVSMAYAVTRHGLQSWLTIGSKAGLPLTLRDLMKVQCSAMLYSGRLSIKLEQTVLDKLLPRVSVW
jgi:predicted unusual protein kinase regulating ubiquinone biosynthesis (AarF/ABC1/UbiB family)